jgi:hypothetical protein
MTPEMEYKKIEKYHPLIANIQRPRPEYQADQTTIIVSPTGALLRESLEKLSKVSKLPGDL